MYLPRAFGKELEIERKVWAPGFWVWGFGFGVQGLGFGV